MDNVNVIYFGTFFPDKLRQIESTTDMLYASCMHDTRFSTIMELPCATIVR